jgi:hypothetical protein
MWQERWEKTRDARVFLPQKHEGTRPLGTPEYRWQDNIEMYLK